MRSRHAWHVCTKKVKIHIQRRLWECSLDGLHDLDSNDREHQMQTTVRCKTIAMPNPKLGRKAPHNQLWEFHFALVGTNKVQTLGYNFVPRVM